MHLNTI